MNSERIQTTLLFPHFVTLLSLLLPLPLPGARRCQAPQHYVLLPPSVRTPAFPRHAHQRIIGLTWSQSPVYYFQYCIFVRSPSLFPAAALIVICLCYPCADTVPVPNEMLTPVPAALLQHNSLQLQPYSNMNEEK